MNSHINRIFVLLYFFRDLKGVITKIDDQGHLVCSYLGTDPSMFVAPSTEAREINYDDQDAEMKNLNRLIKEQMHKTGMKQYKSNGQFATEVLSKYKG